MGKLNHAYLGLVFAGAFLAGCGTPATEKPNASAQPPAAGNPPAEQSTQNPKAGPETAQQPSAQTAQKVPKELQNDAYAYWGLENSQPQPLKVTNQNTGDKRAGKQIISLDSVKDGVAKFSVRYEGLPLPNVEYTLKKDGVYGKQAGQGGNSVGQLQLPADPSPGKTWRNVESLDAQGKQITMTTTYRVVGPDKVKTVKGVLAALLVTGKGEMTVNGTTSSVSTKMWLVKGLGAVRMEMTQRTGSKAKPVLIVSEIE